MPQHCKSCLRTDLLIVQIVGGNKQLTSALLKASGATVKLGVKVTSVVKVNSSEATSPRYVLYAGDKRLDDEVSGALCTVWLGCDGLILSQTRC